MRRYCYVILSVGILSLSACGSEAAKKEAATPANFEIKPVAEVHDIMASLIMPAADVMWKNVRVEVDETGIHEYYPKSVEEWGDIEYAAMGLAETANLLMLEGRAVDQGDWAKFSNELRETSLVVAKAAKAQDPDKVLETGGYVYEACKGCHDKYLEQFAIKRENSKPAETPLSAPPGLTPPPAAETK
jgi:hypothetical protein